MTKLLNNTPVGLLIGFSLAMLAVFFFDRDVSNELKGFYIYLLSAAFSLLSAALALLGVFATIEKQQSIRDDALLRKLDSAKVMMPNALSSFSQLCTVGFQANFVVGPSGHIVQPVQSVDLSQLLLTAEVTQVFRDVIENCRDDSVRRHIAAVLREHQILYARSSPNHGAIDTTDRRENYRHIVHWAYLYALVGTLFGFARDESSSIDEGVDEKKIQGALRMMGVHLTPHTYTFYNDHIGLYARAYQRKLA